jgi:hypothetical protein
MTQDRVEYAAPPQATAVPAQGPVHTATAPILHPFTCPAHTWRKISHFFLAIHAAIMIAAWFAMLSAIKFPGSCTNARQTSPLLLQRPAILSNPPKRVGVSHSSLERALLLQYALPRVYASQSLPLALPGGASPYAPPIRVALSDEHGDSLVLQMMAVVEGAQNKFRSFALFATEGAWKPVCSLPIYAEGACKVARRL